MIDFLIKSTISLTVFLCFYHLILEREKMHTFNRFYLLFSIIISFAIPFLTFEIIKIVPAVQHFDTIVDEPFIIPSTETYIEEKTVYMPNVLWSLYGIISMLLLVRFGKNIWKLISKARSNPSVNYQSAKLVLIEERILPHTFLNSIFINFDDYNKSSIEDELYAHELVHVTQKHTLDILFIEILKVIFWFNPLFYYYKKAIQLNHEFLADEAIVKTYNNVLFYQNLLLQKSNNVQTIYLASNLNYLVTKKRLLMMTKNTSRKMALLKKVAIIPILAGLIYFFCIEIVAQKKVTTSAQNRAIHSEAIKNVKDAYYSGLRTQQKDERKSNFNKPKPTYCPEVQTKQDTTNVKNTADLTEKPDFIGGIEAFYKYIGMNFKIPDEITSGKIFVTFIIEKDGSLSNIKILRDLGYGTGDEVIRLLKNSPKWKPGKIKEEVVRTQYSLPIMIQSGK